MGQGASTVGSVEGTDQGSLDTPAVKDKGLSAWKKLAGRESRSSAGSRSSCSSQQKSIDDAARIPLSSSGGTLSSGGGSQDLSSTGLAAPGSVTSAASPAATPAAKPQQQQQQGHPLPPRPPLNQSQGGNDSSSNVSNIIKQARRSGSLEGTALSVLDVGPSPGSGQPRRLSGGKSGTAAGSSGAAKQQAAAAGSYAGSRAGSVASAGSGDGATNSSSRASFSRDAESELPKGPAAAAKLSQELPGLHAHNLLKHNQQQQQGSGRASIDSCASKASSVARSARSSFAAEAVGPGDATELDHYGRPSFAAFEPALKTGRGAVFEASLPADLAEMYRRLAVLLPQAPIPLVTVLQLWGITDPVEAQEAVQIFVMQGVLKVATLPDGAAWLMVSPEHQQYILADHPESVKQWHLDTLNIYKRQVVAARYMQQQQQGLAASAVPMQLEDVQPSQLMNDGYIWLAVTHHLLGAGQLSEVRALLTDPSWLEVKLHCYGVAAVVDDFRNYLQVEPDLAVKAVLQAFQMSLSCCMERSHLPMMQHQLVLRLMAAAKAAASQAEPASSSAAAPRLSINRNSSAGSTKSLARTASSESADLLQQRQQEQYRQFQQVWFPQKYAKCRAEASLLGSAAAAAALGGALDPQGQQQQLPPHLMGFTPSLRQAGGRHRMGLRGHLGPVRKVVITPDGKDVLTASDDGTVQVWDMDIGDCVMQLRLPDPPPAAAYPGSPLAPPAAAVPLTTLAVTGDGGCCLCGDAQGWLSCWNLKTGQLVQRLRAHRGRLNAIALDSSGSRCITAGEDATAKLWSLPAMTPTLNRSASGTGSFGGADSAVGGGSLIGSLQLELEMTGHGLEHLGTGEVLDVALSNDGVLAATVSNDMKAKVWDLDQQQCVQTLRGHTGWIVSVKFIGSTHNLVTASHDGTARVWDAWTGECLGTLLGHNGRLNSVSCSTDGRTIVTCSDDMTARVWETFDYTCIGVLEGHSGWINDVAIPRSSHQAVTISGDGTARVWDTKRGKCLQVLQGHSDDVTCVVLTGRGRFVVTGSVDGTAQVWDLAAEDVLPLDIHDGKVISVVACLDGYHAASIGADGCLRLWELATGACVSSQLGHASSAPQALLVAQDGRRAFSSAGNRELIAWNVKTGIPSVCLSTKQGSRTKCTHVSADGGTAVVLLFDSSMAVYDTKTGEVRCHLMQRGDRDVQRVHSGGVNAVFLTADGSKAVSVSKDTTARVWDTTSGVCTLVLQGHEDSVHTAVLSSDESLLATASFDCTVRLWDFVTGDCLKVLQHTDPVTRVAFSPYCLANLGSARIVTACEGRALWLWDVDSGACVAALGEHKEAVTSVAFSPDGLWLASTSQDRSVLVWESGSGRLAGLYVGDAAMLCCTFAVRGSGTPQQQQQVPSGEMQQDQQEEEKGKGDTAAALVAPKPGGLTLVVGDASGHVHFIDCL